MNRTLAACAALLSLSLAAPSANAGVRYTSYGWSIPIGEETATNFSARGSLVGGELVTGSTVDVTAAPAFSQYVLDTAQYLSVPAGGSAELFLSRPVLELSVYVGSLDTWNSISFGGPGGVAYTGTELGAISGQFDGDRSDGETNGRFVFTFDAPVTSVTFSSSEPAFEIADVGMSVPEPGAWALMLVGFGALGGALRGSRLRSAAEA